VDGSSIGATGTYTFVNVTNAHSLAATFAYNAADAGPRESAGPGSGTNEENGAVGSLHTCVNTNSPVTAGTTSSC